MSENVIKYGRARVATVDDIIERRRVACCIIKNTDITLRIFLSHGNSGYANAPQCYVMRALPVLSLLVFRTEE